MTAAWDDLLEREGQVLVLSGNEVSLLSPVGSAAALAAREGIAVGELRDVLLAQFGAPPDRDADEALRAVVEALLARGVLRRA